MRVVLVIAAITVTSPTLADTATGGEASVTLGGKPEFYTKDDEGKYALVTMKAKAVVDKTWVVVLTESIIATEWPQKKTALTDPILSLAYGANPLADYGLVLETGLSTSAGVSLASRDSDHLGNVKGRFAISVRPGSFTVGVGAAYTRMFDRYTFTETGAAVPESIAAGFGFVAVQMHEKLSLSTNLAFLKTALYAGAPVFSYSNSLSLSWEMSEHVGLDLGVTTSDSQLSPNGTDNNDYTLYKVNKTEMYVSAAYSL